MKSQPIHILSNSTAKRLARAVIPMLLAWVVVLLPSYSYSQVYTVDWSQLMIDQYDCGLPISSGASGSYSDVDTELMTYDGIQVEITHGPEENLSCASGKIRYLNGGNNYTYSATLNGESISDCSWMIIRFSEPVTDVSFDLIDIDQANLINWQDKLTVSPKWSSIEANNNLSIDEIEASISGNINCESGSIDCNTHLQFSEPVLKIRIDYCYGDRLDDHIPDRQIYNIGNISFSKTKIQPQLSTTSNCSGEYSEIDIQGLYIEEGQQLQVILGNEDNIATDVTYDNGPKIVNQLIKKRFLTCGTYPILVRLIDLDKESDIEGKYINELIPDQHQYWLLDIKIEDNNAPYFTDKVPSEVTLYCDDEVPPPYYRESSDICTISDQLDQSVTDYETTWNEECYEYSISRVWTVTDLCGNVTMDSTIYTFIPRTEIDSEITEVPGDITIDKTLSDFDVIACNAFSPNGDGVNDFFTFAIGSQYKSTDLYIYDRYGSLRHEQHLDGQHVFASDFGGELDLSIGVYVWITQLTSIDGSKSWSSGEVTLIK